MAAHLTCQRCGARITATAVIACTDCGAPLPIPREDTVDVPRRLRARRTQRLSQVATIPDARPVPAGHQVRPRQLAPSTGAGGMDYDLQAVLGEGGMGVVWSARQAGLLREVAVKRARPAAGLRAAEQLLAEAILTGSLEHPGIVPVHEVGIDQDGVPFYAMRRLRGRTWAERWGDMNLREHLDVLVRVCDPIAYAHGQGVIHRDLKPGNVFLGEYGEVVVFDWGLAVRIDELNIPGRPHMASGTPAYMAPEMARADFRQLGPLSDVYLLGAILYEILTDVPPHPGEEVEDILIAAADNVIDPAIPDGELGTVAIRAMAADPAERYPDVRQFQRAVRTCIEHQDSVSLSGRAHERLIQARKSGVYDDFARSVHGFEDAVAMWPGNASAISGLSEARLAYAIRAREAGDFDLAAGLLDIDDLLHQTEISRIAAHRSQRLRRRRALRVLAWTTGALLAALIIALILGYTVVSRQRDIVMRIAQERDAAESALAREQAEAADGRQRLWHRILQEDFRGGSLPPRAKVLAGDWSVSADALRIAGIGPGALLLPVPDSTAIHIQVDVHVGGSGLILLGCTEDEILSGHSRLGLSVAFDDGVTVLYEGHELIREPLREAVPGLPRRLRIEYDDGDLRILVDGWTVVPKTHIPGMSGRTLHKVGLHAQTGTVFDNLKLEVPWR